jgi:long-chain fatty acid transport protein
LNTRLASLEIKKKLGENGMIKYLKQGFLFVLLLSYGQVAFASYEFLMPWSAKEMSMGGAATASVDGSQSLYFNPAGLANLKAAEMNSNISPYIIKSTGSLNFPTATTLTQSGSLSPNGGLFWGTKLNEKLGIGVGVYGAAGATNKYGVMDLTSAGAVVNPEVSGNLADLEFAVGAGYHLTPELSIGAAWRVSVISSYIKTFNPDPANLFSLNIDGLTGSNFAGFRFGAQYRPVEANWGLGASFRTAVPINLKNGTISGVALKTNTALAGAADGTVTTSLPWELTVGGYYQLLSNWRFVLQYDFAQYNSLKSFDVTGTLGGVAFVTPLAQNWNNQSRLRLGTEVTDIIPVPIRLGYVLTSQVIPNDRASTAFATPPGLASGFAIGSGVDFTKKLHFDGAISYVSGSGDATNTAFALSDGHYTFTGWNFHTTFIYKL